MRGKDGYVKDKIPHPAGFGMTSYAGRDKYINWIPACAGKTAKSKTRSLGNCSVIAPALLY